MTWESPLKLPHGGRLRLMELLRLRIRDVDRDRGWLEVHAGKGDKVRVTVLPASLREPIRRSVEQVRVLREAELREGDAGGVDSVRAGAASIRARALLAVAVAASPPVRLPSIQ